MFRLTILLAGAVALCGVHSAWGQDKSTGDADLDRLVRLLKNNDLRIRKAAADELGRRGDAAKPAARPLCNTIFDPSPIVAKAALQAFEKVQPDLCKPVAKLALEGYPATDPKAGEQAKGIEELGDLQQKALPTIDVLLLWLKKGDRGDNSNASLQISKACLAAIKKIKMDDDEVIKSYKTLVLSKSAQAPVRVEILNDLDEWAGTDDAKKKQIVPILKSGLNDTALQLASVRVAGRYGPLAKELIPTLKKLKANKNNQEVRDAAEEALQQIDKGK
jgi:HEAT repeat protein